jgi:O-antigen/teichoic acid export membrane protein
VSEWGYVWKEARDNGGDGLVEWEHTAITDMRHSITTSASTSTVLRNSLAIAASTILARGLQFLWAILLARLVGEAGYGIWGLIASLITILATLPEFGMGLIVLRDVSRDRTQAGKYLAATLVVQPLLALLAHALLVVIAVVAYESPVNLLLIVAGGSLLLDTLGNIGHGQLLAAEQMVVTSAILVLHIGLQIAFAAVVLFAGGGLLGLYIATLTAGLCRAVMYWLALRHLRVRPQFPVDGQVVRALFWGGWPLAVGSFLTLIYTQIDRVLVFSLLGERQAGNVVSAFVVIFGVTEIISITMLTALFPLMSRLAVDHRDELRRLTDQLAMLTLLASIPLAVLIAGLASRLSALLFPGFVSTSQVLELLIWQAVVQMVGSAFSQLMVVEGKQTRLMVFRLIGLAVNIALNLLLLPRLGISAVSLTLLVTQAVMVALFLTYRRPEPVVWQAWVRQGGRILVAGGLMLGVLLLLRDVSPILAAVSGGLTYVALIVALRALRSDDWALLRRVALTLPVLGRVVARYFPPPVAA